MCGGCGFASLVAVSSCPPPAGEGRRQKGTDIAPHVMTRRRFVRTAAGLTMALPFAGTIDLNGRAPETLYNGITLASPWPPRQRFPDEHLVTPPYLADPPAVIPIDVGRQLFVDDFLIEETTMWRTCHRAAYHAASPVLSPETPWELEDEYADRTGRKTEPVGHAVQRRRVLRSRRDVASRCGTWAAI